MERNYVIGIDFGTDSARAVLVDAGDGSELSSAVSIYSRWSRGLYCDPAKDRFRQHPLDYIQALEDVLKRVLEACPDRRWVRAIAIDSTASTPCLVDSSLTPLCLYPEFENNPDAMFILWKDHTAAAEAAAVERLCAGRTPNYLCHSGGAYSAESYWAKVLHVLRSSPELQGKAFTAVEECDFITAILTGNTDPSSLYMNHGIAGEKRLWAEEWGGYPPESFFGELDPVLLPLLRNLPSRNHTCERPAGHLCPNWAEKLGLGTDVVIGVGNVDSYSGAVGAGIASGNMVMNLGTSACCMAVVPSEEMGGRLVEGVFGQVEGMILPGHDGFELGLSAFGDAFAWLRRLMCWPLENISPDGFAPADLERLRESYSGNILSALGDAASKLPLRLDAPLATDYFNGRRSPSPDSSLTATLTGLKAYSSAPEVYYAVVESTAFATKAILDHLEANDVKVDRLVAVGGVARKSPFVMRMMADVTGREMAVLGTGNAGAVGAAIHGAVAAGLYPDVPSAQAVMCPPVEVVYGPSPEQDRHALLTRRFERYLSLAGLEAIMK